MHDEEVIAILLQCKHEIISLRKRIEYLEPKAEAYNTIVKILSFIGGPCICASEDLVWYLDKKIKEMEKAITPEAVGE